MADRLLYTGATGFIGGSVLTQLLDTSNPQIKGLAITALVRKQEQADLLRQRGVDAVVFRGLDDTAFLRRTAGEYDYVVHAPTGFHTASAVALIEGLADRKRRTGRDVHFIHTSGTSNLAERNTGTKTTTVHEWSDKEDVYAFEERKEAQEAYGQRTTDVAVVTAGERAGVKTYIMMPPTVYGRGTGLFNRGSMQIPSVIRAAIEARVPVYVGDGTARLGHVHVADLALLYELVLGKVLAGEAIPSGRRGVYFSNTGSHDWRDVAGRVGRAGVALGALEAAEPRSVSLDEAVERWLKATPQIIEMNYASNSATKPDLATELGWKPKKTEKDWEESFLEAFQMVLDESKSR